MREKLAASLNGLLCVYKPADLSLTALSKSVVDKMCSQGNAALGWPKLATIEMPVVEEHPTSGALVVVGRKKQVDYSMHPLVVGEEYRAEDIRIEELRPLETTSSGVAVFGVNDGVDRLEELRAQNWMSTWRLEGVLGRETVKHEIKAKVTRREPFAHVTKQRLQHILSKGRMDFRKVAFEMAEVEMQSSKAFELATRGLPRPKLPGAQVVVDGKVLLFKPPYFALQVDVVGETDAYLRCLVNEIGLSLETTACPVRLIRGSIGPFRAEHTLLERQLSLQNIVDNISLCSKVLKEFNYDPEIVNEPRKDKSAEAINERKQLFARLVANELPPEEFDAMRPAWPRDYA